jgi:hypothetical protein
VWVRILQREKENEEVDEKIKGTRRTTRRRKEIGKEE